MPFISNSFVYGDGDQRSPNTRIVLLAIVRVKNAALGLEFELRWETAALANDRRPVGALTCVLVSSHLSFCLLI
jgi:hypothetical protein